MIESTVCENTNNPEFVCGSNYSLMEVNSQDLRVDFEDKNELQLEEGLLDRIFDF